MADLNALVERVEAYFSADLIPNYATRTCTTRWRGRTFEHAFYDPPENGIHLCAVGAFEAAASAAIYPMPAKQAREFWEMARDVAACERDECDFVVDLCVGGQIDEDFLTNRQLWPRAINAWNAALRARMEAGG